VATVVMILLKINCPNFSRLVWRPYQISDLYGGLHTCDTASGAAVDSEVWML